ncbi:hypothetical protein FI667_g17127, partial [Globisporangium splendens]
MDEETKCAEPESEDNASFQTIFHKDVGRYSIVKPVARKPLFLLEATHGQGEDEPKSNGPTMEFASAYIRDITRHRYPWLNEYNPWLVGFRAPGLPYALFDTPVIVDQPPICPMFVEVEMKEYYINLFFQWRYYSAMGEPKTLMPTSLCHAWNLFVDSFTANPRAWKARLENKRERFFINSTIGIKVQIHLMCAERNYQCAVLEEQDCPMCYSYTKKMSSDLRNSPQLPERLLYRIFALDARTANEPNAIANAVKKLQQESRQLKVLTKRNRDDIAAVRSEISSDTRRRTT